MKLEMRGADSQTYLVLVAGGRELRQGVSGWVT